MNLCLVKQIKCNWNIFRTYKSVCKLKDRCYMLFDICIDFEIITQNAITRADRVPVSASLTSRASWAPSLPLPLSLSCHTHRQQTARSAYCTLRRATVDAFFHSLLCMCIVAAADRSIVAAAHTRHCHLRSLISYLHAGVQREPQSTTWTALSVVHGL